MIEYRTRRTCRGAALQVAKVGSYQYARIVRASDGKIAQSWDSAPFSGRLNDLYEAFERAMERDMPEGDVFTQDDIDFVLGLNDILRRDARNNYALAVQGEALS